MGTVALAGGGTGGHFYPLLAFARYLKETTKVKLLFFGDAKGIEFEKRQLLEFFDERRFYSLEKFKGRSSLKKFLFLLKTSSVSFKMAKTLRGREFKSLLFGGYTSAALGFATRLLKRPLYLHEQNAVPGAANRFLSKFSKRVFLAFPEAAKYFPEGKVEVVGMPIRRELKETARAPRGKILKKLGWEDKPTLLVLGGSQGARRLNLLAVELSQKLEGVRIVHITGKRLYEETLREYSKVKKTAEIVILPFSENVGELMKVSHFALSRAGASTCFELALFGLPALFVPYPYAAYDHQYFNALHFAKGGGALVMREEELSTQRVLEIVEEHLRDEKLLKHRSETMKGLFPEGAERKMVTRLV